jgi:cell division protein ZapD
VITYDYPLNEQVRILLRLDLLFQRVFHFIGKEENHDHHAALMAIFEILDVTARVDVKSDLLQALERQRAVLVLLRGNPKVAQGSLDTTLSSIEQAALTLHGTKGKFGEHLRNHLWLMSIKQRAGIPGGMCDFDLPAYHHWLSRPSEMRRSDLNAWIEPMMSMHQAAKLQLSLLLESGKAQNQVAIRGLFQQGKVGPEVRLLRVAVDGQCPCVPEISANKYLLNIRFLEAQDDSKGRVCAQDIPFSLIFCTL